MSGSRAVRIDGAWILMPVEMLMNDGNITTHGGLKLSGAGERRPMAGLGRDVRCMLGRMETSVEAAGS